MSAAGRLYAAGGVLLAVMPLAMVLANRSSPVVVGLAALAFLAGRWVEDRAALRVHLLTPLATPLGGAALAFLAWALAALAWSPFPTVSLRVLTEFLPTLLAAYLLACLAPGRIPAFAPRLAAAALALGGVLIAVDLAADLALERALGRRVAAFVHNRPALTLDLVAGPVALVLWRRGARGWAAAALGFAALGVLRSISGAAQLGLFAGAAMFGAARLLPRRIGLGLAGLGLGLAVALAPVEGDLLARMMPEAAHEHLVQSSSRARVAIARSFGAAVAADPWRGAGTGTSARFAETPIAQALPAEMRVLLGVGHPHNSFLQVWAELGLPGAILAALTLMLMLARVARLDQPDRAAALGLVACAAAIAFVEHNGWAAWWTAGLGAAISWLREAARPRGDGIREGRSGMSEFDVDLFVIGGGSGGVRAARIAAGYGAKVMLAEEYRVGGTCVIRGCVPKKLMVYAGRFADEFEDAAGFGWTVDRPSFDWSVLKSRRDAEVTRLEGIYDANLIRAGVEIVPERAVIEDAHTVRLLTSDRRVRAERILVAVGAHPLKEPAVPGIELAITSNEVFELERLPERILVIGGGYIAVEFAGVFAALGSRTTLLHRGDKLLRGFDDEVRDALAEAYGRRMDLRLGRNLTRIERQTGGLRARLDDGSAIEVDQILVATGRRPNVAGLGLDRVGIETDAAGAIPVDAYSQTTVPSIYAVGDVTNRANLTPVAIREGHAFADTVFGGKPSCVDHRLIPTAVFSTPEIGVVGHTEAAAREVYGKIDVYKARFRPMKATLSGREERILMKVIVDCASDRVVGVHIFGHDAGEVIQAVGIAVTMGATKADFDRTIAVHPTAAEELVTMRVPEVTKHPVGVG